MRAGNGAGSGSSSRDRTFPVPDLLALPENGSQPSLSIHFSFLIWYYQFCVDVKPFLGSKIASLPSNYSFICLFSHDFPTQ
ncbi:hypothetical protein ACVDG5_021740 [Mesorhizobium sp. ORM6]